MKKDRRSLRSRLMATVAIPGTDLPAETLALQDFHQVAWAKGILDMYGRDCLARLSPPLDKLLREAECDAKTDLATLGYPASASAIDGYLQRFRSWFSGDFDEALVATRIEEAEKAAPPELLAWLPRQSGDSRLSAGRQVAPTLSAKSYEAWRQVVRRIVRIRLLRERAVDARGEHLRLAKPPKPPSKKTSRKPSDPPKHPSEEIFQKRLADGLKELLWRATPPGIASVEQLVGVCAAEVSMWRLRSLRWELDVADMELEPRGSFLTGPGPPKTLRVWHLVDAQLRRLFEGTLSSYATSCTLVAAQKVYAGRDLAPTGNVRSSARDITEKYRKRIHPDLAAEATRRAVLDDTQPRIFDILRASASRAEAALDEEVRHPSRNRRPRRP